MIFNTLNKEAIKDTIKLGLFMAFTTFVFIILIYYFIDISL